MSDAKHLKLNGYNALLADHCELADAVAALTARVANGKLISALSADLTNWIARAIAIATAKPSIDASRNGQHSHAGADVHLVARRRLEPVLRGATMSNDVTLYCGDCLTEMPKLLSANFDMIALICRMGRQRADGIPSYPLGRCGRSISG